MSMNVKRRSDRIAEAKLLKEARTKQARTTSTEAFENAAHLFCTAAKNIRKIMKDLGSDKYENFKGGFDECYYLLQDPLYKGSIEARDGYTELLGADQWLRHEADKLGQAYVSPAHWYKAWELDAKS